MAKSGSEKKLVNRDISWLSFNHRVLQEAADKNNPLIERIKFLGIFSNNLDEFFRVRVGSYRRMLSLGNDVRDYLGEKPAKILERIQEIVLKQQESFNSTYAGILKDLKKNNIHIIDENALDKKQTAFVKEYFEQSVRPQLVPIMVETAPKFPYLRDNHIYLAVKLSKERSRERYAYALIELPADLPRFVTLPSDGVNTNIILLDDIIRFSLADIFPVFDYNRFEAYTIKLTRDAELDIDSDFSKSITEKISKGLKKRRTGEPVRFVYDQKMPQDLLNFMLKRMNIVKHEAAIIPGGRYHNFRDFIKFPGVGGPELRNPVQVPLQHPQLKGSKSMFESIRKGDVLLCFPYQSFQYIIDLLREAAIDPDVSAIKITLYRAARNSRIINALINALRNGKAVTVVVELQARFDEQANMNHATLLQEEGANVIYGVPGLKVHSKLIQISRREKGKVVHYSHVGTGNFNEDTSRIYSDFSLITCDPRISTEVERVFQFFKNNFRTGVYKHLLVAPFYMRKKFLKMIQNEISQAKAGKRAEIIIKVNSLVDDEMIEKLYTASRAGVKVRLIIRGICSLITGIKGVSEDIEAISLVDKYLEHARVAVFYNAGDELVYLSSADWMVRNLDYRCEVACPVYDPALRKIILDVLELQWNGSTKVRILDRDQTNAYRPAPASGRKRAQDEIYRYFSNLPEGSQQPSKIKKGNVRTR